ncbi:MAG: DNA cytosine methyltransferase [Pseudomonadota bacterium]|nr:DNA cytosine methyltransferase [Pseudomonadota bacterium]
MSSLPRTALPVSSPVTARVLELFAGAGGAALGLGRARFAHVACVERNPSAAATLRSAGLPAIEADVRAVDYAPFRDRVELLWASPPCQPGSTAGARLGATDDRDGWPATLAAVDACRPTWFLAENVLGWTYHAEVCGGAAHACPACHLDRLAGELARRFPFTGAWRLDAADYGVPQRRRRLLLWAGPLPLDPDGPARSHAHRDAAGRLGLRPWVTMGDAIGDTLNRASCDRRVCYPCDEEHGRACSQPARLDAPSPTVMTTEEKGTRAHSPEWSFNGGPDRASDAAFLVAGIRRIDVGEGLRLQGFPDDWPLQGTVHDRYVQVGNAVPPAMAEAAGRVVAGAHRAWTALRAANVDASALAGALRRNRLTVPAHLGAAP